jgi:hypothetical protein
MFVYQETDENNAEWVVRNARDVLDELIFKGRDIIIKHNQQHLVLSATPTSDEKEVFDQRMGKLSEIKLKKKGVFAPVRNNLLNRFKNEHLSDK